MNNTRPSSLTAWNQENVFNKSTTAVTLGVNIDYYIQYMFVQWFQNGVAVSASLESSFYCDTRSALAGKYFYLSQSYSLSE